MATFAQSFKIQGPAGYPQPLSTGGVQAINATSATQNYPLGTRVTAVDPVLGEAEFVYAQGVASTAAGNIIQLNADGTTARAAGGTIKGLVGIAMSACVANNFGWYCVKGAALATIAADVTGTAPAYVTASAGVVADDVVAGNHVVGSMLLAGLDAGGSAIPGTTDTTGAHLAVVRLFYPVVVVAV